MEPEAARFMYHTEFKVRVFHWSSICAAAAYYISAGVYFTVALLRDVQRKVARHL